MQSEFFIPAETAEEVIQRIYSLTGRTGDRSRGEKRALLALRDALGLDVDTVAVGSILGRQLASALDVEWREDEYTRRTTITLEGLNVLLEGATFHYQRGALKQLADERPPDLEGPQWSGFRPARKKIEAVTRIAGLTNAPPEWLGPGGKEHKSVFENLARNLFPSIRIDGLSKTQLGGALATELGVPWTDHCYSTQQSITLTGLNTILAGAERYLGRLGSTISTSLDSAAQEGAALVAALLDGLPRQWEGRTCVQWMQDRGIRGSLENEWQGWYNEAISREVLAKVFPPGSGTPRVRYGNTIFDYALNYVWDFKTHTAWRVLPVQDRRRRGDNHIILNDEEAIRACVDEQGLGFLVLSGEATLDESGDFKRWQRALKKKAPAPRNNARSRLRKSAFRPLHVEAFWIANTSALDAAITAGQMVARPQGRQAPKVAGGAGRPRRDKFQMDLRRARDGLVVADHTWETGTFRVEADLPPHDDT